jgi:hypothetical protein
VNLHPELGRELARQRQSHLLRAAEVARLRPGLTLAGAALVPRLLGVRPGTEFEEVQ